MVTAPVFWTFLDMTATAANLGWWDVAAESCIVGLVLWLLGAPMWGEFNSLLTRTYCRRASSCFGDIRLNVKLVFATSLPVVLVAGCTFFLRLSLASPLLRAAMFVVLMMTCSVSYRLCKRPLGGGVPPRSPGHAAVDVWFELICFGRFTVAAAIALVVGCPSGLDADLVLGSRNSQKRFLLWS